MEWTRKNNLLKDFISGVMVVLIVCAIGITAYISIAEPKHESIQQQNNAIQKQLKRLADKLDIIEAKVDSLEQIILSPHPPTPAMVPPHPPVGFGKHKPMLLDYQIRRLSVNPNPEYRSCQKYRIRFIPDIYHFSTWRYLRYRKYLSLNSPDIPTNTQSNTEQQAIR